LWNKLSSYKDSSDEDKRKFALVAQNRLKQLEEVAALEKKLLTAKNLTDSQEQKVATWLKSGKELKDADKVWQKFAGDFSERDEGKKRIWFLLAKKQLNDLANPAKTEGARRPDPLADWWFAVLPVTELPNLNDRARIRNTSPKRKRGPPSLALRASVADSRTLI